MSRRSSASTRLVGKSLILTGSLSILAWSLAACVTVKTPDVTVSTNPQPLVVESPPREPSNETPYARTLQKVIRQQEKISKSLSKGKWSDTIDEAGDWVEYCRELIGLAHTSHDPARFRRYGEDLLVAVQQVRSMAQRQDAPACQRALQDCDPILDAYARDFPMTVQPSSRNHPAPRQSPPPAGPSRIP